LSRRTHPEPINLEITIPAFGKLPEQYFLRVGSEHWVGCEFIKPISLRNVQLPPASYGHTPLMNLDPLPISALQEPHFEQLYPFDAFNPIQTQLFHVLYHTDTPVILGAPTGSGKTIVAEITLLRMKYLHPKGKCVYIAPLKSLARERLKEWIKKLGTPPLKWNVLELSGDTHHNNATLRKADVLVYTPEKWDLISRGWRGSQGFADSNAKNGRDFVKQVKLLIIDEIHLLGEDCGAVLEAIVSRTRFISQHIRQMEKDNAPSTTTKSTSSPHDATRIVGLSTALSNPEDLADWIGIDIKSYGPLAKRGLYNFRPSLRPVATTIHVQEYSGCHYCPSMAAMNKPCYAAIKEHAPEKPVIIFVASRRQTRLTAFDLISYAAHDEDERAFLKTSTEYIEGVAETLSDEALRHTIFFGIGLHHAGLSSHDRETVEKLFLNGDIQVLVATGK